MQDFSFIEWVYLFQGAGFLFHIWKLLIPGRIILPTKNILSLRGRIFRMFSLIKFGLTRTHTAPFDEITHGFWRDPRELQMDTIPNSKNLEFNQNRSIQILTKSKIHMLRLLNEFSQHQIISIFCLLFKVIKIPKMCRHFLS